MFFAVGTAKELRMALLTGLIAGLMVSGPCFVPFVSPERTVPHLLAIMPGVAAGVAILHSHRGQRWRRESYWVHAAMLVALGVFLLMVPLGQLLYFAGALLFGIGFSYFLDVISRAIFLAVEPIAFIGIALFTCSLAYALSDFTTSMVPALTSRILAVPAVLLVAVVALSRRSYAYVFDCSEDRSFGSLVDRPVMSKYAALFGFCLITIVLTYTQATAVLHAQPMGQGNLLFVLNNVVYLAGLVLFVPLIKRYRPSYALGYCLSLLGSAVTLGMTVQNRPTVVAVSVLLYALSGAGVDMFLLLILNSLSRQTRNTLFLTAGLMMYWLAVELSTYAGLMLRLPTLALSAAMVVLILFALPMILTREISLLPYTDALSSLEIDHDCHDDYARRLELTEAECRVFRLLCAGVPNSTIAGTLHISSNTVKFHVRNILHKAHVRNRIELLAKMVREN